jgi:lysophospholipase L1-like esterase
MNSDVKAYRILIYGDSLVFGKIGGQNKRFTPNKRFTGLLQNSLGSNYEIIENGLRGRTLFGENSFFTERDGLEQFGPIAGSQLPCDVVIIILGTNNANVKGRFLEIDVFNALTNYVTKLNEWSDFLEVKKPKIIVAIPPHIREAYYDKGGEDIFGLGATNKMEIIQKAIEDWSRDNPVVSVIDLRSIEPGNGDGIHLDVEGNKKVAELLENKILAL